jgi:toxin ParE1/3/4
LNGCGLAPEESFEMGARSIVPHRHAIDDALDTVDYYRENAGTPTAENFSLAVDEALEPVGQHPNIGSPRTALDLDIEGIKTWSLRRFPHQIYYKVFSDRIVRISLNVTGGFAKA